MPIALVAAVRRLDDDALEHPVAGWPWSFRLMIHGTLHHDLYHAGQIALLRRALRPARAPRQSGGGWLESVVDPGEAGG